MPLFHESTRPRRPAFSLVELLVVVAIIAVLIALLLPAVQSARGTAIEMYCTNNLKQIGTALNHFNTMWRMFPSNGGWDGVQQIPSTSGTLFTPSTFDFTTNAEYKWGVGQPFKSPMEQTGSWAYAILPYVEQEAMWKQPAGWVNSVEIYICPARRAAESKGVLPQDDNGIYNSGGYVWGRTDYGANLHTLDNRPNCINAGQVQDGMSNTVFIGEKAFDMKAQLGSWYYDEGFFLGGSKGTARDAVGITRDPATSGLYKSNWGSAHKAGALFLFGDGSVHLLVYETDPILMTALLTPAGGEVGTVP